MRTPTLRRGYVQVLGLGLLGKIRKKLAEPRFSHGSPCHAGSYRKGPNTSQALFDITTLGK